jgi:predicted ribonuclease YlaK
MTVRRIAAFPDTNLFLHFRPLSEIDWCGLLQASAIEIKIAPVVTRELEEQKILNPSRKLRERASTALKLLHSYLGNGQVRQGVTLEFLINEPTAESTLARAFNLQLGDDRLLGTLLLFRDQHPDVPCTLVTSDLPLIVKATHYQIQLAAPSEALRLPSEPDVLEKKNKQLEAELLRYKSREPVLEVRFESGESHSRFQITGPDDAASGAETSIQSMLAAAKAKCPLIDLRP